MSKANQYDVIVIGGGHNGLVAAAYMAKFGRRVLVLERRYIVGGATVTEEIFPGFKFSVCSYVVSLLRPEIIRDLNLSAHGLEILPLESTFTPLPDQDYLIRWGDHDKTRRELYRHSPRDADTYDEYGKLMYHMAHAVQPILNMVPPDLASFNPADLGRLGEFGMHLRGLDKEHLYWLSKLMTSSSADFLDEWFETEALKATMSSSGIIGTFLGPRSPGTAYVLLHHYMGEIDGVFRAWGFAKGGTGMVADAIASSAQSFGAEIKTNAPVSQVIVKNGKATGVVLENGDEYSAKVIISGADPKRSFLQFIEPQHLPSEFLEDIRRFKITGSSGKVNLALDGLPNFTSLPGDGPHLRGAISISPSIEYLERAYDDAKYGDFSREPYIDVILPSLIDPHMAPPGQHVMSCFVQYAPFDRKGGWDDQAREAFGDTVINTLEQYAPNLKKLIVGRQVLTPLDIQEEYGLTGGNIFHGELSLYQLFFLRPSSKWANYRTPIRNYYQCGSGTHPGGGIAGTSGRLAALEILKDRVV
jgi:phytoene dehydrogenase-like protein